MDACVLRLLPRDILILIFSFCGRERRLKSRTLNKFIKQIIDHELVAITRSKLDYIPLDISVNIKRFTAFKIDTELALDLASKRNVRDLTLVCMSPNDLNSHTLNKNAISETILRFNGKLPLVERLQICICHSTITIEALCNIMPNVKNLQVRHCLTVRPLRGTVMLPVNPWGRLTEVDIQIPLDSLRLPIKCIIQVKKLNIVWNSLNFSDLNDIIENSKIEHLHLDVAQLMPIKASTDLVISSKSNMKEIVIESYNQYICLSQPFGLVLNKELEKIQMKNFYTLSIMVNKRQNLLGITRIENLIIKRGPELTRDDPLFETIISNETNYFGSTMGVVSNLHVTSSTRVSWLEYALVDSMVKNIYFKMLYIQNEHGDAISHICDCHGCSGISGNRKCRLRKIMSDLIPAFVFLEFDGIKQRSYIYFENQPAIDITLIIMEKGNQIRKLRKEKSQTIHYTPDSVHREKRKSVLNVFAHTSKKLKK
jgi:hypothetical protein